MIERIRRLVNADANLVRRGRFLSTTFLIEIGDQGYLVKILEGRVASITPGPFVTPNYSFALRAPRDEWEMFWTEAAAARPPRHFRAVQARQADHRRRPAAVHGEPALHQGRARHAAPDRSRAAGGESRNEPALRADRRPLSQLRAARPPAPALHRGGRPRHSAALPAHRGLRRPAVSRPAQRQAHHRQLSASSCSTCRGTANPRRRRASRTRNTSSPRATTCRWCWKSPTRWSSTSRW